MTIRTASRSSLNGGTMVPLKHSKVEVQYIGDITHYGYFSKNGDGTQVFLGRLEIEVDAQGREIRIEFFSENGGIFT